MWTLLSATFLLTLCGRASAKIVDTLYGPIDGTTVELDDGTLINSWLAVPFARPPVGDLRFERPVPPESWTEVRETKAVGPVCMQDLAGAIWITHPLWSDFSEDCLHLNIHAPDDLGTQPLPVMVYFYGGGFKGGGNIQYPGHFLAARGVIVVVPNYRLGVLGFASTSDGLIKGNMGLWDQTLALRWVRNNIARFGGNPDKVTIFGQSAGAASSSIHMVSPYSQGLFHQAIMQSGTEGNLWTINYPGSQPDNYIYQTAEKVNCPVDDIPAMVACLRQRPARLLVAAQDLTCAPGYFCMGYAPIVDGPGGFIPKVPLELKKEQSASSTVPIISGICRDDGSLYTIAYIPEANDGGFNSTEFNIYLKTRLLDFFAAQMTEEQYDNIFETMRWYYVNWPYLEDLDANREAFNKLVTDGAFGYPWDRQLKLNSEKNPNTYGYVQSFLSPNSTSFIPAWMGVPHEGELPYVWSYGKLLTNPGVREDNQMYYDVVGWTPEDATYANFVEQLWTNFAKVGYVCNFGLFVGNVCCRNPTPQPVKAPFDDKLVTWEKFSWDDNLKILDLDTDPIIQTNFRQQRNALFYDLISYFFDKELKTTNDVRDKPQFNSRTLLDAKINLIRQALAKKNIKMP